MEIWEENFSEYDLAIDEFKEALKKSLKQEVEEEVQELKEEVIELRELKKTYSEKVADLEREKIRIKMERDTMKESVRRERLSQLLGPLLKELWKIGFEFEQGPKCDKCDSERFIHFYSPQGNECREVCECAKETIHYLVKKSEFKLFTHFFSPYSSSKDTLMVKLESDFDRDEYVRADRIETCLYNGEPFAELNEKYGRYGVYFEDKNKAQEYADWLNQKEKTIKAAKEI